MTATSPTLEDLLAEWWRDSYPHASAINNQTAALIVAFAGIAQPTKTAGTLEEQLAAWLDSTRPDEHINTQTRSMAVAFVAWVNARRVWEAVA